MTDPDNDPTGIPKGYWWKAPLLLGPAIWFGMPLALVLLQIAVVALSRPFAPSSESLVYLGLIAPLGILASMLQLGSVLCAPALLPGMAMAAWLIHRGHLSFWIWGPAMSAYAVVLVGGGLTLLDVGQGQGPPPVTQNLLWVLVVIGVGGLLYGLAFRAALGWFIRRRRRATR